MLLVKVAMSIVGLPALTSEHRVRVWWRTVEHTTSSEWMITHISSFVHPLNLLPLLGTFMLSVLLSSFSFSSQVFR